jgi:hypothetical protein
MHLSILRTSAQFLYVPSDRLVQQLELRVALLDKVLAVVEEHQIKGRYLVVLVVLYWTIRRSALARV